MVPDKSLWWPIAFALPWDFSLIRSAETNCGFQVYVNVADGPTLLMMCPTVHRAIGASSE
jgi:hypothetical protein